MPVPLAADDMTVDGAALTAGQEKEIVRELSDAAEGRLQEGDTFYLISSRWWRVWQYYSEAGDLSRGDSAEGAPYTSGSVLASRKRPFSIDNSDLVVSTASPADQKCEPELRENLLEDRDYVLTPEQVWLTLDKWYGGGPALPRKVITVGAGAHEDLAVEVYPLQLHLLVVPLGSRSSLKVSKRETIGKLHQLICEHFKLEEPEKVRIWDYFDKHKNKLLTDPGKYLQDAYINMNQDILVEVQINGRWPDENTSGVTANGTSGREMSVLPESRSIANGPPASKTVVRNGSVVQHPLHPVEKDAKESDGWLGSSSCATRLGPKGLSGLQNLGNTCFMNSALQCLVHTPPLAMYFLQDYSREINRHNPLGMEGELAIAFGELLRKLWAPGKQPIAPRPFKTKLARFAPQFSGYNQHDSQELLAFLLDGLHEDLNRVKNKPYVEAKDASGRPDREVAAEYWANHRSRNDSVIVDVCQGQYKSTLVCPVCSKVSVTFDPFMYLSLPLPAKTTRTMTVTVFSGVGSAPPTSYTVTVPRQGRYKDLIHAIGIACNLGSDERLLLAELYNHRIFRLLEEPQEWLTAVRDDDRLAAYRLPKQTDKGPLLILLHRHLEVETHSTKNNVQWKLFAAPLITHIPEEVPTGAELLKIVHKLLSPMEKGELPVPPDSMEMDGPSTFREEYQEDVEMSEPNSKSAQTHTGEVDNHAQPESGSSNENSFEASFQLWTTDDKGTLREGPILMDKPVPPASNSARASSKMRYVAVDWSSNALAERFEMSKADMPPEVLKTGLPATSSKKARQEAVSLYTCLESFLKEEPLGPDDMWYCPSCKEHRQASKKLDLWRLPEILVVHLKRFSYSRFLKNKLETFVNFPVLDLDLSSYVASTSEPQGYKYELYAISNHYGSMGGGHYTAYAKLIDENKWYNFDDSHVSSVSESDVKTSAAYVLFYRRIQSEESLSTDELESRANAHVSSNRDLSLSSEAGGNKSNLSSI